MTSTHSLTNVLKADSHGRVRTPADQREVLQELYDQSKLRGVVHDPTEARLNHTCSRGHRGHPCSHPDGIFTLLAAESLVPVAFSCPLPPLTRTCLPAHAT